MEKLEKILWMQEWAEMDYENRWGPMEVGKEISLYINREDLETDIASGSLLDVERRGKVSPVYVDQELYEEVKSANIGYRLKREQVQKLYASIVRMARDYAAYYHRGQTRKSGEDFMTHPKAVEGYLHKYSIESHVASSVAWLHDVLEDTDAEKEEVEIVFGKEIASGVWALTNKTKTKAGDWENYKKKIDSAGYEIQMVKLCDLLHNVSTLHLISRESVEKKFKDCDEFYLPLAKEVCLKIGMDIQAKLIDYLRRDGGQHGKD